MMTGLPPVFMATSVTTYDSAQSRRPFEELRHFWEYRGLIGLLVQRDLTVRYKRSVLGVWWTLLNPLLTIGVFWLVFSRIFDRQMGDTPFIVYLSAGVLLSGFFSQGVNAAGTGIVNSRGILAKVYVPPEVFSLSTAVAAAANFALSLVPLVVILLIQGVGVPWTFALIPVSMVAMLMLVAGLGLIVASVAVMFYDVFDLVRVLTTLVTYLSAVFYPVGILPDKARLLIHLNPVFHHISVFRAFAYGDTFEWTSLAVVLGSGLLALAIGVWVFSRNWRNVVVAL